jgi:ABC-type antimicrobial peptide transport system permease subunit
MVMTAESLGAGGLTYRERQAVAATDLRDATTVFLGVYMSILIVGVTMNLAITRQARGIALLRAIGAAPGQVRRSIALQAALVAVLSSVLGFLAAVPLGYGWTVSCAFAAVAALNALITVLVGRGRDLAVARLAGGTRADVVRIVAVEAGIVTVTGLVLSTGVAVATLVPMLHADMHTWLPYVPAPTMAAGIALAASVVAAGMVAPAAVLTRRPPIDVVRSAMP